MRPKKNYRFHTRVIHEAISPENWEGATLPPIFQTASHHHATAESLSMAFAGKKTDHIYMRLTNPTNRALEEKLSSLEGGQGAVVMSSGMAAIANACMALLRAGDEFVTGNSFLLLRNIFHWTSRHGNVFPLLLICLDFPSVLKRWKTSVGILARPWID